MPTAFQSTTVACVRAVLQAYETSFEVEVSGLRDRYYRLRITDERLSERLEIYVYEDEAGFFTGNVWEIWERCDYDTPEQLRAEFVQALEVELSRASGET